MPALSIELIRTTSSAFEPSLIFQSPLSQIRVKGLFIIEGVVGV